MKRKYPFSGASRAFKKRYTGSSWPSKWSSLYKYRVGLNRTKSTAMASTALKFVRKLQNEVEKKYITTNTSTTMAAATLTWYPVLINGVQLGTTTTKRIGTKLTVKKIQIRWQAAFNAAASSKAIRVALVYDRKPVHTVITGAMVYDSNDILGNINSIDKTYAGRFKVLYDETFANDIPQATSTVMFIMDKVYVEKDLKVEFNTGDNGTIADIEKGAIYLMFVKEATGSDTEFYYNCKVTFVDA